MTDFDDLDRQLHAAGERFRAETVVPPMQPPSSEVPVEHLPDSSVHGRWLIPLAAASILAIVVGSVVAIQQRSGTKDADKSQYAAFSKDVPRTVTLHGQQFAFNHSTTWRDAYVDAVDPRVVHVVVENDGHCLADTVGLYATRGTDASVTIEAAVYWNVGHHNTAGQCIDRLTEWLSVTLPEGLDGRSLLDGHNGEVRPVRDGASVLVPTRLPAGFRLRGPGQAAVRWAENTGDEAGGYLVRTYTSTANRDDVTIRRYDGPLPVPTGSATDHRTVLGHDATGSAEQGSACVTWRDGAVGWAVCYTTPDHAAGGADVAEATAIANSLMPYQRPAGDPNAPPPGVPSQVVEGGTTLVYYGENQWSDPVIVGRTVTVEADSYNPKACGRAPKIALYEVASNGDTVTLAAAVYGPADDPDTSSFPQACTAVGYGPTPVSITLTDDLANRPLVDHATGESHLAFAASTFPTPTVIPDGYEYVSLTAPDPTTSVGPKAVATRTYRHGENQTLTVERYDGTDNRHQDQILKTGTVQGHEAVVAQTRLFPDNVAVTWTDGTYSWAVRSFGSPAAELSPDELLAIANSLR